MQWEKQSLEILEIWCEIPDKDFWLAQENECPSSSDGLEYLTLDLGIWQMKVVIILEYRFESLDNFLLGQSLED